MATVRMSMRLRDQIVNLAMSDYDKTVASSDKERIELDEIIGGNWMDCALVHDLKKLQTALDTASAGMTTQAHKHVEYLRTKSDWVDSINVTSPNSGVSYSLSLDNRVQFFGLGETFVRFSTLKLKPSDFGEVYADRLEALLASHENKKAQAREDRAAFHRGVRDLLNQCNTVKQLLTAWPAAEKLLPTSVIHKMHEKVERKFDAEAAKARANFDPTQVNTTMLTAALLGDVA